MKTFRYITVSALSALGITLAIAQPAHATTNFPKPFPLTNHQKSDPEFSPYGVVVMHNQKEEDAMNDERKDKLYQLLSEAGVKWIRLTIPMVISWGHIEPQKGVFNWNKLDKEIQLAGNHGIQILGTLHSPCSKEENQAYFEMCRNLISWRKFVPDWWDGNDADFQNIINKKFIDRYSTPVSGERKVQYWMNFSEWNGTENYVSSDYFTRYFRMTAQIIKAKSSVLKLSAPFLGEGLIGEATGDPGKLDSAFSPPNSAGQYHDFLAFHKYANYNTMNDRNKSFIKALKAMADFKYTHPEYNVADKPVWVTEGGYGCNITPGTACDAEGEQLQADDLQKRYWIALHPADYGVDSRLKIEKIFWFRDISRNVGYPSSAQRPVPPEGGTAGLIRNDTYQPRPSYYAYKAMALWYTTPGTPQLTAPPDNGQITTGRPVFTWQAPTSFGSEGFKRYVIQVDDDQYFTSPIQLETSNPWGFGYTTAAQYQPASAIPNGSYVWRVKVEDTKGNFGSWSQSRKMTIGGNPADLNQDGKVDVYDYNLLVTDFGKTGTPGWIKADIIKNGKVDIFDYNVLVENFGQ